MKLSRREALRLGGFGMAGAMVGSGCGKTPQAPAIVKPAAALERPRNVILMVSDGMSSGVLDLANSLSLQVRGRPTHWYECLRRPETVHGLLESHSLNSMVTDSAAAATAWATGSRVNNGSLNHLPDGTPLVPLAPLLQEAGRKVGLIVTDAAAGATPAGFAAVSLSRYDSEAIVPQYAGLVDVLLAGGRTDFDPLVRKDGVDWIGKYQHAGYEFVSTRREVLGRPPPERSRLLGLFSGGALPYTVDHLNDPVLRENVPTLAEMARHAFAILKRSPEGFFAMVEGARVDHAAHMNDAAGILWDQLAFDDAVGEALAFAAREGNTLVIITTDHGNANPGLNGIGAAYADSTRAFEHLAKARGSFDTVRQNIEADEAADQGIALRVQAVLKTVLGADISAQEAEIVGRAILLDEIPPELWAQNRRWVSVLGRVMANVHGVSFTGTSHTSNPCPLAAVGPGAGRLAGLRHHVDFAGILREYFGV